MDVLALVYWPKACVGCGETDPNKLNRHDYEYRNSVLVGSSYSYGYRTNQYSVTTLGVDTWVCNNCKTKARIRYLLGLSLLLIHMFIAIGVVAGIVAAEVDFGDANVIMIIIGTLWIMAGIIFPILWLFTRINPAKHYHKVRKRGSRFAFTFRNQEFLRIFEKINPGEIIKYSSWFP
ncbi:MAG: hypothetical protein EAX96_10355 [Candidatus Lokiarchaeota archaeon]|nr:hypothetical protein [Candidatus Lokiarchaeota archaeon]